MIEGMNQNGGLINSNSTGTKSRYMLKLFAIESPIGRQCCTQPCGLCKASRTEQSLTGCTKPYGLNCGLNRPGNL
jgi:hypothetical protein